MLNNARTFYASRISSSYTDALGTLWTLVCKQTPTMHWVLPCFMATENSLFKTRQCEVTALEK